MTTYLQADSVTKEPVCNTISECDTLMEHLQGEIDELEKKGSLSKDENKLKYNLRKQLLTVQKAKSARQKEIIADLNMQQSEIKKPIKNWTHFLI